MEVLKSIPADSVDACVTDPPYGINFMGKKWDYDVPSVALWTQVIRVLKPGGHLLSFAGTRTYHRMTVAIEDAGFDIRDQIGWLYGTGFPKSHNLHGEWEGWGTALKPAWEPIALARKPFAGTVSENVRLFGCGALNIEATRIPSDDNLNGGAYSAMQPSGRWPANVLHDGSDEVLAAFPDAAGALAKSRGDGAPRGNRIYGPMMHGGPVHIPRIEPDKSASRFFYCAKATKADRAGSTHPTVKPLALMRYLCTMITPPGGIILDPFAGSGTTGQAASDGGFSSILVEREADYCADIRNRLALAA